MHRFLFHRFWIKRLAHNRGLSARHVWKRHNHRAQRRNLVPQGNSRHWPHTPNSSFRRRLDCAVVSAQQATSSASQLYAIRMRLKDGGKFTLADEIDSRQEARWVVSQIETLAGLKLDTHVEVDLPLGVTQQLPGQKPGQVFTPSGRPASAAASMGVFFVMIAGMFGFMAWRMTSFTSRAKNSRTAAAAPVKPVARRVFFPRR